MRRLAVLVTLLAMLVTAVSALAQGDTGDVALVRVAHFVPGTDVVDVFVDGVLSDVQGLDFGEVSGWVELAAGSHDFAVAPAGGTLADAVLTLEGVDLAADDWVTVAAVGSLEVGNAFLQPILEDFSEIPFGETRLTVVHAIPNAGPVNVQLDDGTVLIQTLAFPQTLGENDGAVSVDLVAGPRTIQITPFDDPATILFTLDNVMLASGKNNLVALAGLAANAVTVFVPTDPTHVMVAGAEEEVVETGEGPVQVRVAHFAPGAGEVDVYANGELSDVQGLLFGEVTDWFELPAGYYDIAIAPVGTSLEDAVIEATVPLIADEWMTVVAYGSVELGAADVEAIVDDFSPLDTGMTRLSVFHGIPNAGPVNVQLSDGTVLIQTIGFPGSLDDNNGQETVDIVAGPHTIQITPYDDPATVLFEFADMPLSAGMHYHIAVVGLAGDAVTVVTSTPVE